VPPLTLRHCERSEAIHSFLRGKMDCFAALAMTAGQWIASRSLSSGAHSRDPLARNDRGGYFNAAISLVALSSSTFTSSLRLAGATARCRRGAASRACADETPPVRRRLR